MLKRGTQIIYVPGHADGDLDHPDCEEGFITSAKLRLNMVFCRYWSKHHLGELRTKANSEGTPIKCIVIQDTHPQTEVDALLETLP
jgi:hypothetical protein